MGICQGWADWCKACSTFRHGLAVLHTITTARAAPINLSQRKVEITDEAKLSLLFDRFARWHNARAVLQVMNFGVALWATVLLSGSP